MLKMLLRPNVNDALLSTHTQRHIQAHSVHVCAVGKCLPKKVGNIFFVLASFFSFLFFSSTLRNKMSFKLVIKA